MYEESVQPNSNIDNSNKIANNTIKKWMEEPNSFPEKTDWHMIKSARHH